MDARIGLSSGRKSATSGSASNYSRRGESPASSSAAGARRTPGNAAARTSRPTDETTLPPPSEKGRGNPAADGRSMRRIIADDPEWSLATVPDLVELVIKHIVNTFAS